MYNAEKENLPNCLLMANATIRPIHPLQHRTNSSLHRTAVTGSNKNAEIIVSRPKYVRNRHAPASSFSEYDRKDSAVTCSGFVVARLAELEFSSEAGLRAVSCWKFISMEKR